MSTVEQALEDTGLAVGKAVLAVLVQKIGVDNIIRYLFENQEQRVNELLSTQYQMTDASIETLKNAVLGERPKT